MADSRHLVVDMQVDKLTITPRAENEGNKVHLPKPLHHIRRIGLPAIANQYPGAVSDFMLEHVRPHLSTQDTHSLAQSCRFFRDMLQPESDKRALQALLDAIIHDHQERVKKILNARPWLLICERQCDLDIKSLHSWRTFKLRADETPLAIAAKNKQIKMIELLLPYFNRLEQDDELKEKAKQTREDGLKAWSCYEMDKNEIVIPKEYTDYINKLIDVFCREILAPNQTDFTHLSDEAEGALHLLLSLLVPKTAVELDNHVDVELLLLAAYQLYNNRYGDFNSWEGQSAFCVRVIGLIQSALTPEMAKIFCQGLYDYVNAKNPTMGSYAASLKLNGGEAFYREARESLSGLGGKFLCAEAWRVCGGGGGAASGGGRRGCGMDRLFISRAMSNKNIKLAALIQHSQHQPDRTTWCVIS